MLNIEGRIADVLPVPIGQNLSLFITFRDGRIIKFQCPLTKFLQLNKKTTCVIHCTDQGLIKDVEIKPELKSRKSKL